MSGSTDATRDGSPRTPISWAGMSPRCARSCA
ncbi:hypothetical protein IW248_001899 [Micromonospora ureilytica]|uniref:Uncharacterized protein n=1 Tax=Micromonospora ureilytica TaxID=709868 RepID=A0ABS0JEX1_9ACTN|nr:hypothetical protein [Micromonospora ureilytica]